MPSSGTRKTWPDETPEQIVARIREQYGDAEADLAAALIAGPVPKSSGRRKVYAGDKRSHRYGVLPVRGKASRWVQ